MISKKRRFFARCLCRDGRSRDVRLSVPFVEEVQPIDGTISFVIFERIEGFCVEDGVVTTLPVVECNISGPHFVDSS